MRVALDNPLLRAVAVTALVCGVWVAGWLPPLERPVGDLLLRLLPDRRGPEAPVVAVVIDDAALRRLGPLPPPRAFVAEVVERLWQLGAAGVVVDMILVESRPGDGDLAEAFDGGPTVLAAAFGPDGRWLLPLEELGGQGRSAHAYAETAPDGVVRSIAFTKQVGGLALPALSLAGARLVQPGLPVVVGAIMRPAFRPPPQEIPHFSALALVDGRVDRSQVAGRVAFLGLTATGAGDVFVVPTGRRGVPEPGVLVHASAAASVLNGDLLAGPTLWALAVGAFLVATLVDRLRPPPPALRPVALAAAAGVVVLLSVAGLAWLRLQMPVVGLVMAVPLAALVRVGAEQRAAEREAGRLLEGLVAALELDPPDAAGGSAAGRLAAVRSLQGELARRNALQRALLDGLEEGVVLWDHEGRALAANRAAERLWGGVPSVEALAAAGGDGTVARGGRTIEARTHALGDRRLGLLRDVTAERELEARRREMQRLVSHELRTPLASIAGLADMLRRYSLDPGELERVANLIGGESRRLMETTSAFLELERLAAGAWSGPRERLDLAAMAAARCELLAGAAEARGQRVAVTAPERCPVDGSQELLARVVDNLVGNALAYSAEGGEVTVRTYVAGSSVVLEVSDSGPGISPEALPRIFDRFYRAPGAAAGGTGLGLALVREVVEWHGGRVEASSEVGVGTTFRVELPAAAQGEAAR